MKKPYEEPKMTVEIFEELIATTGRPGDLTGPSGTGGEIGGSQFYDDEEEY